MVRSTFTEQNGMPVNFQYGAAVLTDAASDPSVVCPDGEYGPCVGARLQPMMDVPYPPKPTCVPLPPNYNNCSTSSPPPPFARASAGFARQFDSCCRLGLSPQA